MMKASRGLVEFIYDGDQLVKIDTYRTSGGSPVLERRLMIYYAGAEVNKIEQYLSPNGVPFLSSFITYSYNGEGKMIQKKILHPAIRRTVTSSKVGLYL